MNTKKAPSKKSAGATKVVKMWYDSCCGCGCETMWYSRVVPADSNYKDGQQLDVMKDTDKYLGTDTPEGLTKN